MASLTQTAGLRVAVEGCGHGTLHEIYASVKKSCELKGWPGVDLLIIGGDFQAVRNAHDLKAVSMPEKYYAMHDFHEYYSGARSAPYLTIFIGGNHEASNYMWELYYGGWAAPNIYYMGAANVIRLGSLRIAGLSGIWKGYNYRKPHHERLPYNNDDVKSIYHVRELDVRKLLQLRSQVDVGLSHDWPNGMEWKGNYGQLFRFKPYFEQDAKNGQLGSIAATTVLERLRPPLWFSAHMHAKFTAVWEHAGGPDLPTFQHEETNVPAASNEDEVDLDIDDTPVVEAPKNDAEIDLDLDEEAEPSSSAPKQDQSANAPAQGKLDDIRSLLPDSFAPPPTSSNFAPPPTLPFPQEITNRTTKFLALDKCLPGRQFLQLLEIAPHSPAGYERPLKLEYDPEWLAITRVFASELQLGNSDVRVPQDKGDIYYRPLIEKEMAWVDEHIVKPGKMVVPENFAQTAPVYEPATGIRVAGGPEEYSNPHTQAFCDLLQIPNPFHATDEERLRMMQQGPKPDSVRPDRRGGYRGGRGRGQGRGRGGPNVNRGRGRGRAR
ncbi:lariat debranching enzyme [Didymosphaeria variabile]|uniref:Lariat debranching enzyme n=1 Tax=Didymosphaeria variabile TaxID=1932322 RepID=A0A9W8XMS4_9PLEO|nr:lariat debranching enzyme [Didymosphaeria variabile]KAJ4354424.1 lariat debranching enzyme [Didymosphaeria variabile]